MPPKDPTLPPLGPEGPSPRPPRSTRLAGGLVVVAAAWPALAFAQSTSLTVPGIVAVIGLLILSLSIHEAAHAWVAYLRGDSTAKDLGRMTPDPRVHIDPFMTVILPAMLYMMGAPIFGGAKPVPVVYSRLHHPLRDMMLVALAGPVSNFLQAIGLAFVLKVIVIYGLASPGTQLLPILQTAVYFNVLLAAFNLFPIPPLDGSRVMAWLLPANLRRAYVELERFGLLLVVMFFFMIPTTRDLLRSSMYAMYDGIDWIVNPAVNALVAVVDFFSGLLG